MEHTYTTTQRTVMKKGYQGQMYDSTEPVVVCSCGWEFHGSPHSKEFKFAQLDHRVRALEAAH